MRPFMHPTLHASHHSEGTYRVEEEDGKAGQGHQEVDKVALALPLAAAAIAAAAAAAAAAAVKQGVHQNR